MTTTTTQETKTLEIARVEAIAASGWGAQVRLVQPRNLAFWVWAVLVGWGILYWLASITSKVAYYAPATGLAVVVFGLYGAGFWWFTQRIDRYAAQPGKMRLAAFLWGGFAATWVASAPANQAASGLLAKLAGQSFAASWAPALTAPISEEWSKGVGLILLIIIGPQVVRTAFDGFILGAFLGLGFQILEDISYIQASASASFGADQIGATLSTLLLRLATGVASHILFTAVFCTGLVYLLGLPAQPRRVGKGVLLVGTAMAIHALWDCKGALAHALLGDTSAASIVTGLLMLLVPLTALVICVVVFRDAVVGERGFMHAMLAPEVVAGVVTAAEAEAAAGTGQERRRFRKSGGGHRRNQQLLDAVFDLAHEIGKAGGTTTDRVEFARSEVTRLRTRTP